MAVGARQLAAGEVLAAKYRVKRVLGEGGVGIVVRATHVKLGQDVAIKLLRDPAAPARVVERFAREARAAAQLRGEHTVRILDVEEADQQPFIVMEYLEGRDLDRVVRESGALPAERVAALLLEACEALAEAHALGIIHRDIKPANLFLAKKRDGGELIKLLDFGISKAGEDSGATITEQDRPLGSPAFMSPEQLRAAHDVDARSDVWSLGVAGYFMVSGRLPFAGTSATQVAAQIAADEPAPLDCGEPLRSILRRCLAKPRDERFSSIIAVADALAACVPDGAVASRRVALAAELAGQRKSVGSFDLMPVRPEVHTQTLPTDAQPPVFPEPVSAPQPPAAPAPARRRRRPSPLWLVPVAALVLAAELVIHHMTAAAPCTLRVRLLFDLTGPTRDVNGDTAQGIADFFASRPAIGSCTIDVETADSKYDVETTRAVYRAWRARPDWKDVSTVFVGGTPMVQTLGPLLAEDHKVLVSLAYSGALAAPVPVSHTVRVPSLSNAFVEATLPVEKRSAGYPNVFFAATDYSTSARVAMSFLWKRGARRVAFFACTTSAFCTDPVDGAKTFLTTLSTKIGRDLAIELDDDEPVTERKLEAYFRAELDRAKQDPSYVPVDWVWFGNQRTGLAHLGRALARVEQKLGFKVSVIANNWALDESLYAICGDACVGFFGVQPLPAFGDASAVGMAKLLETHAARRQELGEPKAAHATAAYVAGYVAADAWQTAVATAGAGPDGSAIQKAFEKFLQTSIEGFASLTFTHADHRPQAAARVYELGKAGTLDKVGQPLSIALDADGLGW